MQERGYQKIQILFKVKSLNKINIFKNSSSSNKEDCKLQIVVWRKNSLERSEEFCLIKFN